jgi:DNA-binding response OmpR family regulator
MNSLPRRILVVDDDPVIRNLICTLLTRRNYGCAQAANGSEVVTLLQGARASADSMPYDLVILDMMMPMVSGWDVLETVERELPDFKKHIVIVSAAGAQLDELSSKGYGAVIEKPFDTSALYDAVERCLRGPHAVSGVWQGEEDAVRKIEI